MTVNGIKRRFDKETSNPEEAPPKLSKIARKLNMLVASGSPSGSQGAAAAAPVRVSRALFGASHPDTNPTPPLPLPPAPPPPPPEPLHDDWLVSQTTGTTMKHNGTDFDLTFLGSGRFKNVYRINDKQPKIMDDFPNDKLVFKRYKLSVDGEAAAHRANKSHQQSLKKGLYSLREQASYEKVKGVENDDYRVTKAFFFKGYSLAEYVAHDQSEMAKLAESVQGVKDQAGFDALPAATKAIYAKLKAFFAFAFKVTVEHGITIDANTGNLCLETVGDAKRVVYFDNYELESDKEEGLMNLKRGLKAFAGETKGKSFSPFIYNYLLGPAPDKEPYIAAYNSLKLELPIAK